MSVCNFSHFDDFINHFREKDLLLVNRELIIKNAHIFKQVKVKESRYLDIRWRILDPSERLHFFIHLINQTLIPLGKQLCITCKGRLSFNYIDGTLFLDYKGLKPLILFTESDSVVTRVAHVYRAVHDLPERAITFRSGQKLVLYRKQEDLFPGESLIPLLNRTTPQDFIWEAKSVKKEEIQEGECYLFIRQRYYPCHIIHFQAKTTLTLIEKENTPPLIDHVSDS